MAEPDAGERLDRRALTACRDRLREIDEELDEAQSWNDPARAERIQAERELTHIFRVTASIRREPVMTGGR